MQIVVQLGWLVIGFVMLAKGAEWFVDGASQIADRFGIPQIVVGLTIVAIGTSLPEAAVSISAAVKGSAEITIGNVLGSNIMNVLVILGLTAVICAVPFRKSTVCCEIPFTIVITAILAFMGVWDNRVSRIEGFWLLLLMAVYLLYLLNRSKNGTPKEEASREGKRDGIWKILLMVTAGGTMTVLGSDVTVDAATELATLFGMGERFIGLTIVAFGTSLPELVTSVAAAVKGKPDIAVGNIIGSNIFNILFVVGTTAVIAPVVYSGEFMADSITAIAAMALLLLCVARKKRLARLGGAVMLAGYAAYFVYLMR